MAESREQEHEGMDAPEVIDRLEDLALSGREGYVCCSVNSELIENTPGLKHQQFQKLKSACFDLILICLSV